MDAFIVMIILAGVVIIPVMLLVRHQKERERTEAFTGWAAQNGWTYTARDRSVRDNFDGAPFARGGDVRHILEGEHRGHRIQTFEYSYTQSTGGNPPSSTTYYFQVTATRVPVPSPRLEVSREHFGHKLLSVVGVHDFQVDDDQFDKTFRIRTDADDFGRRLLQPTVTSWMINDHRAQENPFRIDGDTILTWRKGRSEVGTLLGPADYLVDLLERVPSDAWRGTGERG